MTAPAPPPEQPRDAASAPLPVAVARFPAGPKTREWARSHGFADWRVARLLQLTDEPARLLDGLLRRPPQHIRANPLRTSVGELEKRLVAKGFSLSHNELDANVLRVRHAPMSAGATVEHLLGMSSPQDLASSSAPLALQARPGDVVADLAAAPGIKTIHVAGDLGRRGAIVAVEPGAARLRGLRFNLERCGVATAVLRNERAQDVPGAAWADKVLVDAPCTGEGTLPKDKARRQGTPDEIAKLCAVQDAILEAADRLLKPGGTLVYATCTFAPEENEGRAQRLVARGYRVEELPFNSVGGTPLAPGVTQWPGLELDPALKRARRFLPGIHPTLGFFVVRLRKPATADVAGAPAPAPGPQRARSQPGAEAGP